MYIPVGPKGGAYRALNSTDVLTWCYYSVNTCHLIYKILIYFLRSLRKVTVYLFIYFYIWTANSLYCHYKYIQLCMKNINVSLNHLKKCLCLVWSHWTLTSPFLLWVIKYFFLTMFDIGAMFWVSFFSFFLLLIWECPLHGLVNVINYVWTSCMVLRSVLIVLYCVV